jgi:hypothetical protein
VNAFVGGWQLSSILRFNSGVPANIVNGRTWPTNWNLQGNATCAPAGSNLLGLDRGPCPATQNSHSAHHSGATEGTPNLFATPMRRSNTSASPNREVEDRGTFFVAMVMAQWI